MLLGVLAACAGTPASDHDATAVLRDELARRMRSDQEVRAELVSWVENGGPIPLEVAMRMKAVDADNTEWVAGVLDERGWPTRDEVGEDGMTAVFLLVQHADDEPDLQRRALPLLAAAVDAGDAKPSQLALLTDRVRLKDGRPQLYGSQIRVVDGEATPFEIEDPERVDERRAAMGLEPMAEYLKRFGSAGDD